MASLNKIKSNNTDIDEIEAQYDRFIEEGYIREILSKFQPRSLSEAFIIDFSGNIKLPKISSFGSISMPLRMW